MEFLQQYSKPCTLCRQGEFTSFCLNCIACVCSNQACKQSHKNHAVLQSDAISKHIVLQQIFKSQNSIISTLNDTKQKLLSIISNYANEIEPKLKINSSEISQIMELFEKCTVPKQVYDSIMNTVWIHYNTRIFNVLDKVYEIEQTRINAFITDSIKQLQSTAFPIQVRINKAQSGKSKNVRKIRSCEENESQLLHKYIPKDNIFIFTRPNATTPSVLYVDAKLPSCCDTIMVSNTIYVAGGKENGKYTNRTFHLRIINKNISPIDAPTMKCSKAFHTLCRYKQSHFLSIGGYNGDSLKDTEVYSIAKKSWFQLPCMNEERYLSSACVMNDEWVYVICGMAHNICLNTLERLKIREQISWEYIVLHEKCKLIARQNAYCAQISPDTILLFGGICDNNLAESAEIVVKSKEHVVKEKQGIKLDEFYCSSGVEKCNNTLYAFSKEGKAFSYSISYDEWNYTRLELSEVKEL